MENLMKRLIFGARQPRSLSRDRDRPAATFDEPIWLGGEAMIAPGCLSALREASRLADEECADPGWLAI